MDEHGAEAESLLFAGCDALAPQSISMGCDSTRYRRKTKRNLTKIRSAKIRHAGLVGALALCLSASASAAALTLSPAEQAEVVAQLSSVISDQYVVPSKAKMSVDGLARSQSAGAFSKPAAVAESATRSVASGIGRQVLRGLLGGIFGGKR